MTASESGQLAINIFNKHSNIIRINELFLWKEIFTIYDGNYSNSYLNPNILEFVSDKDRNLYLVTLASASEMPLEYLKHLSIEGEGYLLGLFLKARFFLLNDKMEEFKIVYNLINDLHYSKKSKIDYAHILKLMKNNEEILLKDYLINHALYYATEKQNIYFMKAITISISSILAKKKRYKDALNYRKKLDDNVLSFQLTTQITLENKTPQ
jgi:hypothetical protein